MWYRDGNCYIYLYRQGQSCEGPAFRVPFSALLEANCYPLIRRFLARDSRDTVEPAEDHGGWARRLCESRTKEQVELYIPAPPESDEPGAYKYHLTIRNFFAFIFRRSMVGEHLGVALVDLMHSLHEYRTADVDNVRDLMAYLEEVSSLLHISRRY